MISMERQSLAPFTTLRAGGPAQAMIRAQTLHELRDAAASAQTQGTPVTVLGWGSNMLPADRGVPGLCLVNEARELACDPDGRVTASTGIGFQEIFLKTAQAGLGGLEFAVGIPGTLGGALVSNAGAYRSNVSEFLTELEIVQDGKTFWTGPEVMQFSYRDSILRRPNPPQLVVTQVRFQLPKREPKQIYDEARDYQRQRISKQPPPASAGSFFKNVNDQELADRLETLPERLRSAGVVPAGYLIEACGLSGLRHEGAQIHPRHANFLTNVGGATASAIRRLAEHAKARVRDRFGVVLEEEALYLGDWSDWIETGLLEGP